MLAMYPNLLETLSMTNPEHSFSSPDDINQQFEAIMDTMAIQTDGSYYYMPLDEEKETIVQASLDQIQVLESDLNSDDPDVVGAALIKANMRMNNYLLQTEGLRRDDEVIANGDGIVLLIDRDDPEGNADIYPLSNTARIRGTVNNAAIGMVPPIGRLAELLGDEGDEAISEDLSTESYMGVHLHIREGIIEVDGYEDQPIPDNIVILLPLNYPGLKLKRIIRQAAE
jgi:hypothetical protein